MQNILFILVGTHGVTILILMLTNLIIESAIRESGEKRSSLEMSWNS